MSCYCFNKKKKKQCTNPFKDFLVIFVLTVLITIVGTIGFYMYHKQDWLNALYNATLILTSVGSPENHTEPSSMIFTSLFSLFTCLFYLFIVSFFVTSWLSSICNDN